MSGLPLSHIEGSPKVEGNKEGNQENVVVGAKLVKRDSSSLIVQGHEELRPPQEKPKSEAKVTFKEAFSFKVSKLTVEKTGSLFKKIDDSSLLNIRETVQSAKAKMGEINTKTQERVDSIQNSDLLNMSQSVETSSKAFGKIASKTGEIIGKIHNSETLSISKTVGDTATDILGIAKFTKTTISDINKGIDKKLSVKNKCLNVCLAPFRFLAKTATAIVGATIGGLAVTARAIGGVVKSTVQLATKTVAIGATALGGITAGIVRGTYDGLKLAGQGIAKGVSIGAVKAVGIGEKVGQALKVVGVTALKGLAYIGAGIATVGATTLAVGADLAKATVLSSMALVKNVVKYTGVGLAAGIVGLSKGIDKAISFFESKNRETIKAQNEIDTVLKDLGINPNDEITKVPKRSNWEKIKTGFKMAFGTADKASMITSGLVTGTNYTSKAVSAFSVSSSVVQTAGTVSNVASTVSAGLGILGGTVSIGVGAYKTVKSRRLGNKANELLNNPKKAVEKLETKANDLEKQLKSISDPQKRTLMEAKITNIRERATALKNTEITPEMKAIATQISKRQGVVKYNMTNIVKGGLLAAGGTIAIVVGLSNPIGLALTGGALLITAGISAFKIHKGFQLEERVTKLAGQAKLVDEKIDQLKKSGKENSPEMTKLKEVQNKISLLRNRVDPKYSAQTLEKALNGDNLEQKQHALHIVKMLGVDISKPQISDDKQEQVMSGGNLVSPQGFLKPRIV